MSRVHLRHNLRWRLTIWYGLTFSSLLFVHIALATLIHYRQLFEQVYYDETQELKATEGLLYQKPDGSISLHDDYFNHPQTRMTLDHLLQVMRPDGAILYRSARLNHVAMGGLPRNHEGENEYHCASLHLSDGRRVLMVSHLHRINGQAVILRLGYDAAPLYNSIYQFFLVLLLCAPISIFLTGILIYRVTHSALLPLSSMMLRARQINAEHLDERLPVFDRDDELGQTAAEFNALLERLSESFVQLRRFTSDASHELRTPLASLRSIGEVALQREKDSSEYREIIASMLEEVARLTSLVDRLLMIARSDSGQITLQPTQFRCSLLVDEICDLVGILAEEKKQYIQLAGDKSLETWADRNLIRQALLNVLENAIKYSPTESTIYIRLLKQDPSFVRIEVEDEGPGIPPEERTKIFDRFARIDDGRSREKGGAGLGLSIARWAVEVNGGSIQVMPPSSTKGSCFAITLPCKE